MMKYWIVLAAVVAALGLIGGAEPTSAAQRVSSDGARVPPLTAVIDAVGASWTLASGEDSRPVLRNGVDTEGRGSVILIWQGQAYVLGDGGVTWWKYTGALANGWENRGAVDPSTIQNPPFTPLTDAPGPALTPAAALQQQLDAARAERDRLLAQVAELQRRLSALETAAATKP